MRVELFGVGTQAGYWAITAQRRINCYVEKRQEFEKTNFALIGRPGLSTFVSTARTSSARGMWAVNTLTTPLLYVVYANTLFSIDNGGAETALGTLDTSSGDVSMADDGTYLVIVDGSFGYYLVMATGVLTKITDGNFTSSPETVTWQDTYFIVTSGALTKQFQLSANDNPASWPAVNINFVGVQGGRLQAGISDHQVITLFGDVYTTFYNNVGSPGFPLSTNPQAAQQYGLAAAGSMAQFDNGVAGLFQDKNGNKIVAILRGFTLEKISDGDIDTILQNYSVVSDAQAFAFTSEGHPFYVLNLPSADACWMYDAKSKVWSQMIAPDGSAFWCRKGAFFINRMCVADSRNGNLYQLRAGTYTEAGSELAMEVVSKHIWSDNKYIGIQRVQIDVQAGVGTATGQGADPQMQLSVSKDGGNSFFSVGYSSIGAIGEYTQRVIWNSLGSARDWVLKLRITDPVKRVITGATAEITVGSF